MAKALFFLLAGEGDVDALQSTLVARLEQQFANPAQMTVQLMRQPEIDYFYNPKSPHARPQFVLEVITSPGKPMGSLLGSLRQILRGTSLDVRSTVLLMQEHKYIPGPPQPFYYHYLMVKRADFELADYLDYYSNYHCRMGLNTPNLGGYSQNTIDQAGSEALARELGLGCREVTSISEMKIPDLKTFISSPALMEVAGPALADEEHFVDRANSVAFTSEPVLRLGDFEQVDEAVFEQHFPSPG